MTASNISDNAFHHLYNIDVLVLSAASCILSILAGIGIVATFIAMEEIRSFARKLLVSLTIADVISASAYLASVFNYIMVHESEKVVARPENCICKTQSFFSTYSSIVSFLLTSMIAIYLLYSVQNTDRFGTKRGLIIINIICWLTPVLIAGAALAKGVLGSDETETGGTGPWCWISTDADDHVFWMFFAGKGWELACYLITTFVYVIYKLRLKLLIRRNKRDRVDQIKKNLRDEDKNFLYAWFLLYVLRLAGTIRFFIYITLNPSDEEKYMKRLLRIQAFGDPAQAFGNFLLYCVLDGSVRTKLKKLLCRKKQTELDDDAYLLSARGDDNSNGDGIEKYGSVQNIPRSDTA